VRVAAAEAAAATIVLQSIKASCVLGFVDHT
jgi:hypothetical protein